MRFVFYLPDDGHIIRQNVQKIAVYIDQFQSTFLRLLVTLLPAVIDSDPDMANPPLRFCTGMNTIRFADTVKIYNLSTRVAGLKSVLSLQPASCQVLGWPVPCVTCRELLAVLLLLLTYFLTYFLTYLLTYLLTYFLTYLLTYSMEQSPH